MNDFFIKFLVVFILNREKLPILIDFGIVKEIYTIVNQKTPYTVLGIGTPGFISPEQKKRSTYPCQRYIQFRTNSNLSPNQPTTNRSTFLGQRPTEYQLRTQQYFKQSHRRKFERSLQDSHRNVKRTKETSTSTTNHTITKPISNTQFKNAKQ